MKEKKYPLDITLMCSLALEGALDKYKDILPKLAVRDQSESIKFIHEWNQALVSVLKTPKFKKHLNALGQTFVALNRPKLTANVIDTFAHPTRSYHYAKRFTDSFNFATDKISEPRGGVQNTNVFDFGRGLSPWSHLLKKENPGTQIYTIDTDNVANSVFTRASSVMGLRNGGNFITWDQVKQLSNEQKDIMISLGAFMYIAKPTQRNMLENDIINKFKHFYIELGKNSNTTSIDNQIVKKMGSEYQDGWTLGEISNMMDSKLNGNIWTLNSLHTSLEKDTRSIDFRKFKKLIRAAYQTDILFLQK